MSRQDEYKQRNPEKVKESQRRWKERNADHVREYNREYKRQHQKEYRQRKKAALWRSIIGIWECEEDTE